MLLSWNLEEGSPPVQQDTVTEEWLPSLTLGEGEGCRGDLQRGWDLGKGVQELEWSMTQFTLHNVYQRRQQVGCPSTSTMVKEIRGSEPHEASLDTPRPRGTKPLPNCFPGRKPL